MTVDEHRRGIQTIAQQQALLKRELLKAIERAEADGFEVSGSLDNIKIIERMDFDL